MTGRPEHPAPTDPRLREQALTRLAELQREYEIGQRQLQELVAQEVSIRETLLRITGAVQVLRELTGDEASGEPTSSDPGTEVSQDGASPAPGAALGVG